MHCRRTIVPLRMLHGCGNILQRRRDGKTSLHKVLSDHARHNSRLTFDYMLPCTLILRDMTNHINRKKGVAKCRNRWERESKTLITSTSAFKAPVFMCHASSAKDVGLLLFSASRLIISPIGYYTTNEPSETTQIQHDRKPLVAQRSHIVPRRYLKEDE